MAELETRVKYVETVLSDVLTRLESPALTTKPIMAKATKEKDKTPLPAAPVAAGSVRLKLREIQVRYNARIITVTQQTLDADPELAAWLAQKHPEDLVAAAPAVEAPPAVDAPE